MTMRGIDISKWQSGINVKGLDIDFMFCKATEGRNYVDPTCNGYIQQAKEKGIPWGYYHFARENNPADEAIDFYNATKGYTRQGIPVLDYEVWGKNGNDVAWCEKFIQKFYDLTGIWCMIYISASHCKDFNNSWVPDRCALWVAGYPKGYQQYNAWPSSDCPYNIGKWKMVTVWQFTSSMRLSGYYGNLDADFAYIDRQGWEKIAGNEKTEQIKKGDTVQPVTNTGGNVKRYYNEKTGEHFLAFEGEGKALKSPWKDEGTAFKAPTGGTVAIYRFFNPNTGFHMYTASFKEAQNLQDNGWNYEGVPFFGNKTGTPIYRVYNPNNGDHLFTKSATERDSLVKNGWKDEGTAWHV